MCNFIKRIKQVLVELDISAIDDYVIIIITSTLYNGSVWGIIRPAFGIVRIDGHTIINIAIISFRKSHTQYLIIIGSVIDHVL